MTTKSARTRILLVDDEPAIRLSLPPILEMHGFEAVSVGSVPEALDALSRQPFDVLLADLNIGQPGDGFTVVSAMRRTQPQAVTIIITGFPAFETALEAIRNQVDDYIVKPADVRNLLRVIEQRLTSPRTTPAIPKKRMCMILEEQHDAIVEEWLRCVKEDPELNQIAISDEDRKDHVPPLLATLVETLKQHLGAVTPEALADAARHGKTRRKQEYTISQMLKEWRYLRRVIATTVQQHLLAVDISHLLSDLIEADEDLDQCIRASVEGYLSNQTKAA